MLAVAVAIVVASVVVGLGSVPPADTRDALVVERAALPLDIAETPAELAAGGMAAGGTTGGDADVDGVVLTHVGSRYRGDCESAAAALAHAVPCPTVVPRGPGGAVPQCSELPPGNDNRCVVAFATSRAWLLSAPTADGPGPLVVAASDDPGSPALRCHPDDAAHAIIEGSTRCPPDTGLLHAGTTVTRMRRDDVWVAVSLPGHTSVPSAAVRRVVDGLEMVGP